MLRIVVCAQTTCIPTRHSRPRLPLGYRFICSKQLYCSQTSLRGRTSKLLGVGCDSFITSNVSAHTLLKKGNTFSHRWILACNHLDLHHPHHHIRKTVCERIWRVSMPMHIYNSVRNLREVTVLSIMTLRHLRSASLPPASWVTIGTSSCILAIPCCSSGNAIACSWAATGVETKKMSGGG